MNYYRSSKEQGKPLVVTDKRNSPLELLLIEKEAIDDSLLYLRSERKAQKKLSMHENLTSYFETGLNQIPEGIQKNGGIKVIEKVWERIGRLKEKYPSAYRFFDLKVENDGKKATSMAWKRIIPASHKDNGLYFLRTSEKEIDEVTFCEIYNTICDIEASFRILKTDLEIRPVFHKNGENTMAYHLLALLA